MPTILRPEEYQQVDDVITEILRANLVGDLVLQPFTISEAVMSLQWDQYKDMSAATVDMFMEESNFDNLVLDARQSIAVPIAHKEFQLSWRMVQAAREQGRDLETANISAAAEVVATKLDEMIFKGDTNYGVKGITNAGGNLSIAGADFGTPKNAYETFRKARDELLKNKIKPPYKAVLNPSQYGELDVTTTYDRNQREMIEGKFVQSVLYSDNITDGEGWVFGVGKQYMDRATLGGVKRRLWIDNDTENRKGRVYGIEIPRLRRKTGCLKMTGI